MARRKGPGKGGVLHTGFKSKAQWRFFFADPVLRAKYAHQAAHATAGGPKVRYRRLPRKLHAGKRVIR